MTTNIYAQRYGEEGPSLTPNNLGLVYENAIEKNEDGKVNIHKVNYKVDGIDVVGNVYTPAGYTPQGNYAAIVVAHPNGGSKDQTAGLYAQRLAEAGFVTLAFDARYQGESGGEPRRTDKPASESVTSAVPWTSYRTIPVSSQNESELSASVAVAVIRLLRLRRISASKLWLH